MQDPSIAGHGAIDDRTYYPSWSKGFFGNADFEATGRAEQWLGERGFSVGRPQHGAPRGILFGDFDIQKWRNLDPVGRLGLHGLLTGDGRHGPVHATIFATAPIEAIAAFRREGT